MDDEDIGTSDIPETAEVGTFFRPVKSYPKTSLVQHDFAGIYPAHLIDTCQQIFYFFYQSLTFKGFGNIVISAQL